MTKFKGIKIFMVAGFLVLLSMNICAQEVRLDRVEPPSWWTGFKNHSLQLLVHGTNIGLTTPVIKYPGVILKKVHTVSNPNYLFLDLVLTGQAKPGIFTIAFLLNGKTTAEYVYRLAARQPGSEDRKGFSSADVIYLLMPDRFSNGNPANDQVPGMLERADRSNPDSRHGGDIQGIADHVDYLKELGVTTIWCTPLLENNMAKYSYHGYAITDYYRTDPRFGSNADYRTLSDTIHAHGMKLIMDMVFNHCGTGHWWMSDLPSDDWLNKFPEFTRTNYRVGTITDPYISAADSIRFANGWFDVTMPDLNQHQPFLAKYLVQNSIWWIEYAGLDGIRLDTYPYSFKDFMSAWDSLILSEYPYFNIVGECWSTVPPGIAYWQKDALNKDGYNSYLPAVFDFAMYDALRLGFMEKDGWNTGIFRLYDILSQDFVYPAPANVVLFADNHDVNRYLASQDQDIRRLKMALTFVLTTRGIPEIFYGTEALLTTTGEKNDGKLRMDFPGGWADDEVNLFTGAGLSIAQEEMKQFLQKLLKWRKENVVIQNGKLKHFIPSDGVYVYFRYDPSKTVMVVMNNNEEEQRIKPENYSEFLTHFSGASEVITGKKYPDLSQIRISAKTAMILELEK